MISDAINASFEALAGVAILNHCRTLWRDRQVKGVSVLSTAFFFTWGLWNIFYYPHIGQIFSFIGGLLVVSANCLWLVLMIAFSRCGARGEE